ncbi:MAG: PASTA domain-containing protein [Bacteroidales bacterium]
MNTDQIIARIRDLIRYIEKRIVLRNVLLAILILFFGTAIIMQLLKLYTRHNHDLTVPDFSGLSFAEAADAAKGRDLRVVLFDSVFLADAERGTVVEQHPRAGFMVKKNRKIFLTMNAMNPERVAAPNLVDLTFIQARAKLESFGLKVGHISYEPDLGINVVLAQRIGGNNLIPGDSIVKGAKIDLVLGKGLSDEQAAVPNLVGLTLEAANILASDRFLSVGAAVRDQSIITDEDELISIVYKQKPEAGQGITLPMGSAIDVWLTLDSTKVTQFNHPADTL